MAMFIIREWACWMKSRAPLKPEVKTKMATVHLAVSIGPRYWNVVKQASGQQSRQLIGRLKIEPRSSRGTPESAEIFIGPRGSEADATHGASARRSRISLDHFDRAGSPLCAYYVFIMAAYQEPSDKTRGARAFAGPRGPVPRTAPLVAPTNLPPRAH